MILGGKGNYRERIVEIVKGLGETVKRLSPSICVIEEPGTFGRFFKGQAYLILATGAIAGVCMLLGKKVYLVAPSKWYPRNEQGKIMKKEKALPHLVALAEIHGQLQKMTEHELMAMGIGHWFIYRRQE
jgi:hypothetical protein